MGEQIIVEQLIEKCIIMRISRRDHVLKGDISIEHVKTEEQLADIFTKPLDEKRFSKLRCELNILESSNVL